MNRKTTILVFAVVGSLASCSSDYVEPNPNFRADAGIRVSTGVNSDQPCRTIWERTVDV